MARSRVIKPEFWTDEKIGEIPRDSKLLFIGLWCLSDDYGVVRASEKYIKGQLFPYDDCQASEIKDWLLVLEKNGMIIKFESNNESYYYIRTFRDHQKIHNPSKTRNPEPPKDFLGKIPRKSEKFKEFRLETETETETEYKQKLITTFAASDKKTYRLPPKECESPNVQPDVTSGLPVETTQGMFSELPDKTIPDRLPEPSGETIPEVITDLPVETTQGAFAEPPAKTTSGKLTELPATTRDVLAEYSLGQKNGETKGVVKPLPKNEKINFDYETGKFTNVTDTHVERWKEAYPAVDVLTELRQMAVWADTNRKNRKSDWQRFIVNWLKRSQDKAQPAAPLWKGGGFGQFGNSKPTHVGEKKEPKGKYADQVDEVIYTDA